MTMLLSAVEVYFAIAQASRGTRDQNHAVSQISSRELPAKARRLLHLPRHEGGLGQSGCRLWQ
jgi:hypothetical protein